MAIIHNFPVDPLALFYAAITAVENGKLNEIELEFRNETDDIIVTMSIRKEARPMTMYVPITPQEE